MEWIYLSPHFDDVAYSCGGLLWEQSNEGDRVHIWTICGGKPLEDDLSPFASFKHETWETVGDAVAIRRREDLKACSELGAEALHFQILDCIYRKDPQSGEFLYDSEQSLWGPLHPSDQRLIQLLRIEFAKKLPERAQVVSPLALGDHVDHRLTRTVAESLGRPLLYYADFPYVLRANEHLHDLKRRGWTQIIRPISPDGLRTWENAIAAYLTQISTFWRDVEEMRAVLRDYVRNAGGVSLWHPPDE